MISFNKKIKNKLASRVIYVIGIMTLVTAQLLFTGLPSYGDQQDPSSAALEKTAFVIQPQKVENRIKEIQKKLAVAESTENEETANQLGVSLTRLQEHNASLREVEAVYQQQLTSIERRASLEKEEEGLDSKLQSRQESLVTLPPPYNLSTYDSLLDELTTIIKQEKASNIALKSIKNDLGEAKTKLDQSGQKVRELQEKIEQENQTEKSLLLNWDFEYAKVKDELAQAVLDLKRITAENTATELRLTLLKKEITQRLVNWVRPKLATDPDDLRSHLDTLGEQRVKLQDRILTLRRQQKEVEESWLKAQQVLEAAQGADEPVQARAVVLLNAREAWRETYQQVLEQSDSMLLLLNQEEQVWKLRYSLLQKDADYQQLANWQQETNDHINNIDRLINAKVEHQQQLHSEIAALRKQLSEGIKDAAMKLHAEMQIAALNKLVERNLEYLSVLQRTRDGEQRFLDEIGLAQKNTDLNQKIKSVGVKLKDIWGLELWVVDERSVTVKKVVIGLLILIVGMLLAGWFARSIVRRSLALTRLDDNAAAAVEKMLYFLALLILVIFALRSVNIPFTVFTFLGGAFAIGVGFGAQNLLNNFISGFILMAERPVKINDLIEVENNFGIIEKIGMRCTRVRTPGNIHILVPNSSFLEKNIVNWTLSDQEIRADVSFGVVHDSDPREVSQLMLKAVCEHEKVLIRPEPVVLFDEVGDSALKFIVYFWVSMKRLVLLERRMIESDIRYRIMELFREAGIVIAYPQRDIHLDNSKPLDLRLVHD